MTPLGDIRINGTTMVVDGHEFQMTLAYTAPCTFDTASCTRATKKEASRNFCVIPTLPGTWYHVVYRNIFLGISYSLCMLQTSRGSRVSSAACLDVACAW